MRLGTCLSILFASALAVAPLLADDDWASFRGPRGDGHALSGLPAGDAPLGFEVRWTRPLGSGYAGVAVVGDLVVTAAREGGEDFVLAVSAADGSERWRASLGAAYLGHDGSHDGPIATPTIDHGRVFALGPRGRLLALDAASGRVLWAHEVATELAAPGPYYGYASSPRVVAGRVVLWIGGEVGHVAAFDVATGALAWKQLEEPTDAQSPIVATLAGREQIVVIGGTNLAGLDPQDGTVLWQLSHDGGGAAMGATSSSPLVLGDDRLFFKHGADSSLVVKVSRTAAGFVAAVEREVRGLTKSYSPPALAGRLLFGYSGRFLSALDPATGELLWRSREPGDGFLVAIEDQLVVLTKEGSLHLGPASATGWSETARVELFDALAWTPPSVVGSSVYARGLGGIARVDLVRHATAAGVAAAPAVPEVLAPLVTDLATSKDPAATTTKFLAGKEWPSVSGQDVVFVWRGRGADVAIAGDMIGMRREEPMRRLAGTDLWWWTTRLDRRARVSYVFLVDNEPAVDPAHSRRVAATVLGPDLNWQRSQGLQMSWLAMPDWPGNAPAANPARGRVDRFEVAIPKPDSTTGETLPIRLTAWLPPGYDQGSERLPVVYVHDRNAFEHGRWAETLDRVVGRTVAPLITVFIALPRGVELGAAFATTLVPAVDARFRTLATREGRANVGMGWNGHRALLASLRHPELFAGLGIQSYYAVEEMMSEVAPALAAADPVAKPLRIYFEWGRWDLRSPHEGMNMHTTSVWLDGELRRRGYQLIGGEVADSTDFASWRNRTDVLLESLFPAPGTSGSGLQPWLLPSELPAQAP